MGTLTRRKVMLNGILKKGDRTILEVGSKQYRITNDFSKKIRVKNALLGLQTVIFTFIYLFSIEKYRETPLEGKNDLFLQGLNHTFLFLFCVAAGFIITSLLILPKNVEQYVE